MNVNVPLPQALLQTFECPLTRETMRDPVILCESGFSYERTAIVQWIETNGTNPRTGLPLVDRRIVPNANLNAAITHYRQLDQVAPGGPDAAMTTGEQQM